MVEKECRGDYDSNYNYHIKCEPISCHGKYLYNCGDKCSLDETICSNYESFRLANQRNRGDLLSIFNSYHKNGKELGKIKLKNFNQNISTCPKLEYEFKLDHICLSGTNCYEKIKPYRGFKNEYIYRKTKCYCQGIYNYECNSSYCSINKQSCDYFMNISSNGLIIKQSLNKCGNDYMKIIKQFMSYASRINFI
jgi:hypothetical protein